MMNNNGGMRGGFFNRGGRGGNMGYQNNRGGYNNNRGGYRQQRGPHQGSGNYKTVKCKFFEQSKY